MVPRLYEKYKNEIVAEMAKSFSYKNPLQAPRLKKIVINIGMGEGAQDIKPLEATAKELAQITGQNAVITRARKAVSNFKIRKGSPVGCMVTLRRSRMYEFLDRLINVALPSLKDFKGVSAKSFDKDGNYSLGLNEQTVFPEIEYDKVERIHGMDITIAIDSNSKRESQELLKLMGMPFKV